MGIESHFAGKRKSYLAQHHSQVYVDLLKTGQLNDHLEAIGQQAATMMEAIISQATMQDGEISDDYQKTVRRGQITRMAEEIVLNDIVHSI